MTNHLTTVMKGHAFQKEWKLDIELLQDNLPLGKTLCCSLRAWQKLSPNVRAELTDPLRCVAHIVHIPRCTSQLEAFLDLARFGSFSLLMKTSLQRGHIWLSWFSQMLTVHPIVDAPFRENWVVRMDERDQKLPVLCFIPCSPSKGSWYTSSACKIDLQWLPMSPWIHQLFLT